MTALDLPNLRGSEPSTFLAALGVLSLLSHDQATTDDPPVDAANRQPTLCWPHGPHGPAQIDAPGIADLEHLAEALSGIARSMCDNDELLPGAGPAFPPRKQGKAPDPTRSIERAEVTSWVESTRANGDHRPWLAAIVATNDVITSKTTQSRLGLMGRSPIFDAGPGTVSMSGTLTQCRDAAIDAGAMEQALRTGARRDGSTGAYLDWRADRDAADLASKRDASNFGDPVTAWLALMGLRCAPLVCVLGRAGSALCPPRRVGHLRKPLLWPVWRHPLDFDAVTVLLSHPTLVVGPDGTLDQVRPGALEALGVCSVFGSSRLSKGNNDGAYGPPIELWPPR